MEASSTTQKARQVKSSIKTMLICFFDKKGIDHKEFVPACHTVNQTLYLAVNSVCEIPWDGNARPSAEWSMVASSRQCTSMPWEWDSFLPKMALQHLPTHPIHAILLNVAPFCSPKEENPQRKTFCRRWRGSEENDEVNKSHNFKIVLNCFQKRKHAWISTLLQIENTLNVIKLKTCKITQ